jgi:mRNA interferase MazF
MTTYKRGTIVVVDFPATSGAPGKTRPSLVVFDAADADIIIARLTSRSPRSAYDVVLSDWAMAGLRIPTIVRLDKLLTTEKSLVKSTMGNLSAKDYQAVGSVLNSMFAKW